MVAKNYIFGRKYGSALLTNLVAYYNLDANANDVVNSHNGTSTNISYANAGINGNCATFNGSSSYISVPQSTDFDFSTVSNDLPFTISFWSYSVSNSGNQWVMNKRGGLGSNDQWQIVKVGVNIYLSLFTTTAIYIGKYINATPTLNVWEHYVFTYNGNGTNAGINCYKNGVSTATTNFNAGTYTKMPIISQTAAIGRANWVGTGYLNGRIDEMAIWKNRELNATEVAELYNTGTGKFYPF